MGPTQPVRDVVEPLVTAAGLELWDIELHPGVLRILVDRPGGADLDSIGRVSEDISRLLDTHEVGPSGRYLLEVSSPGVERALRTSDQFRRFVGDLVAVKTARSVDGARRFQGVLLDVDDEGIVLGTGEGPEHAGQRAFSYEEIQQAHTVLVWGPSPKPGKRPNRRSHRTPERTAAPNATPTTIAATEAVAAKSRAAADRTAPIKDSAP